MTSGAARITFVSLHMSQNGQSSDGLSPKTAVGDFLEAIENDVFVEDDDSLLLSLGVSISVSPDSWPYHIKPAFAVWRITLFAVCE